MRTLQRWVKWSAGKFLPKFFNLLVIFSVIVQPVGVPGLFSSYTVPVAMAADEEVVVEESAPAEEAEEEPASEEEVVEEESTPVEEATPAEEAVVEETIPVEETVVDEIVVSEPTPAEEPVVTEEVETPTETEAVEETVVPAPTEEENTESAPAVEGDSTEVSVEKEAPVSQEVVSEETAQPSEPIEETECLAASVTGDSDTNWNVDGDRAVTNDVVELGVRYVYPLDKEVTITFTCLPADESKRAPLSIERIKADDIDLPEGVVAVGEYAYDITTDGMDNGDFKYDLSLPKSDLQDTKVRYIEQSADEVVSNEVTESELKSVDENKVEQEESSVTVTELDHFTVFLTVTSGANSSSGALTIVLDKPASTVSGDFLVAGIVFNGGSGKTITPPSGWTLIRRTNRGTDMGIATYWKIAGGAEGASYSWGISSSDRAAGGILRYSGVDTVSPIVTSNGDEGSNDSSAVAPSVTTTVSNQVVIAFFGIDNDTSLSTPSGTTERFNVTNTDNSGPRAKAVDYTQASVGSTGTKSSSIGGGSEDWAAQQVVIKSAVVNHTITASAGTGGTVSPSGSVSVNEGSNQTFTIVPSAGNVVSDVLVDSVSQGRVNSYTFTNVTAAHTISATFDSGWSAPTTATDGDGDVSGETNGFSSNDSYAVFNDQDDEADYRDFNFSIPAGSVINGIEVSGEANRPDPRTLDISLSWNGGTNFTSAKNLSGYPTTDKTVIVGGVADTWGRTWSASEFSNANFRLRADAVTSGPGDTINLDQVQVKVTYTAGDTTVPVLAEVTPVVTPASDSTPSYTFSSDEAGTISYGGSCTSTDTVAVAGNNTITFSALADGTYSNCTVTVTDASTNASTPLSVTSFIVDTTIPSADPSVFSSDPAVSTLTNDQTVTVSWTTEGADGLSGVDGYSYDFTEDAIGTPDQIKDIEENVTEVTSPILTSGTWYFNIRTVDNAGNWTSTDHVGPFLIDATAPAVPSLTSPADGVYRQTSDSNKSDWTDVTDPSSPITYWYESSFGTAVDGNGEFVTKAYGPDDLSDSEIFNPGEPEGTYYWHVKACDNVGNCSDWSTPWQINIDNTDPIVDAGTDKITDSMFSQDATASDSFSGIATYAWSKVSGPGAVTFGTPDAEDTTVSVDTVGTYVLRLTVTDNAGNIASDDFTKYRLSNLTAHKYNDYNANGTQDEGEADLSDWDMSFYLGSSCGADEGEGEASPLATMTTDENGNATLGGLLPGTYSVKEGEYEDWRNISPLCQGVTFGAGNDGMVDFGNQELGTITIHKLTRDVESDETFFFTPSYGDVFTLVGNGGTNFSGFLVPGTYTITEQAKGGWELSNLTCTDNVQGSATVVLGAMATIALNPGTHVSCTYANNDVKDGSRWWLDGGNGGGNNGGGGIGLAGFTFGGGNAGGAAGGNTAGNEEGGSEGNIGEGAQTEGNGSEVLGSETTNPSQENEETSFIEWLLWIIALLGLAYGIYRYQLYRGRNK